MKLIGLTGGISCGKSTVSRLLRNEYGAAIIDCDEIARWVVEKGNWGYRRVLASFPNENFLNEAGDIDREALAAVIFNNAAARKKLNSATHLPILCEILKQMAMHWLSFRTYVVVDMPLLFETGFYRVTRPNIVVASTPILQLERLQSRDSLDETTARSRINAQMPLERKRMLADLVIENNGSLHELKLEVSTAMQKINKGLLIHRTLLSPIGLSSLVLGLIWVLKTS